MRNSLGLGLLILGACTTAPPEPAEKATSYAWKDREAEIPRAVDSASIAPNTSRDAASYTYFLIPSQPLIDAEYNNLRNDLENLGTPENQLQRRAFEGAAGMIASMLDTKYGEHVQGEVLPSSRVMIIKADQELDLSILEDLIIDLGNSND